MNRIKIFRILAIVFGIILLTFIIVIGTNRICEKIQKEKFQEKAKQYYADKVEAFHEENQILGSVDVVFCGDSITDGCNLKRYYPSLLAANRGISGDTTDGVLRRMEVSFYELHPKVIVLLIGGNNIQNMMDNYEDILLGIQENLPDTRVVLLSLTAMSGDWSAKNSIAIENNKQIKALAEKYSYSFVDLFTPMYDEERNECKAGLLTDPVHPGEEGYTLISSLVLPIVESLLENP